jgi:hypothetical protein
MEMFQLGHLKKRGGTERKYGANSVVNAALILRRPTLTALMILITGVGVPLQVSANAALVSDNNHGGGITNSSIGDGKYNANAVTANSPIFDRGFQHIGNNNAGGSSVSQTASCKKKFPVCRISQRAWVTSHR